MWRGFFQGFVEVLSAMAFPERYFLPSDLVVRVVCGVGWGLFFVLLDL